MKKYNINNYIRYNQDVKTSLANLEGKFFDEYTRNELIIKFIPLVENLARKFATSQQASGVMSINDLIQEGCYGLIAAVDKLDWKVLHESDDIEKTLKSFFSKRIKGAIRRAIDINRGDVRIPEHKLNEIRKNPDDDKMVSLFFNSVFSSYDANINDDENPVFQIEDKSEPYNIALMNAYLIGLMNEYLPKTHYDVLRLSYGLDSEKLSANEIAKYIGLSVATANVRVSQIKKEAIDLLIANTDPTQVIDYL
jgi:RNA polymerase sigma factor (sigma-70 family)